MRKIMNLDNEFNELKYVYRIASVSVDKVTLEKHSVTIKNTFNTVAVFEINDETKVGTVTQKMAGGIINDISKRVDEVAIDFLMDEKIISDIIFKGVSVAP